MKFYQLLIMGFVLAISQATWALDICLHARKGHSFVTVQDNGKVVKTFGLWPPRLLPDGAPEVQINKPGDYPMSKAPDVSTCNPLRISLKQLEQKAVNYTDKSAYGPYSLMNNNCTHFAIRIYNYGSGDSFPVVMAPSTVMTKIKNGQGSNPEDSQVEH